MRKLNWYVTTQQLKIYFNNINFYVTTELPVIAVYIRRQPIWHAILLSLIYSFKLFSILRYLHNIDTFVWGKLKVHSSICDSLPWNCGIATMSVQIILILYYILEFQTDLSQAIYVSHSFQLDNGLFHFSFHEFDKHYQSVLKKNFFYCFRYYK